MSQDAPILTASASEAGRWLIVILIVVPLKVREVIKELERAGWVHIRAKGDHRVFRYSDGRITVVSGRLGDDVRPGTYRAILKQSRIKEESE